MAVVTGTRGIISVLPGQGLAPTENTYVVTLASTTPDAGLTAHAGGGQALATPITTKFARFSVVATAADSSVLPPASTPGSSVFVINAGAAAMNVFPNGATDIINALAVQTAFSVSAGKSCEFICAATGKWNTQLSA